MRHYEIVFLVHPDQDAQAPGMIERYCGMVADSGGAVHRLEDCGMRRLAYPIDDAFKVRYVLMNIECEPAVVAEIAETFRFNDAIVRNTILARAGGRPAVADGRRQGRPGQSPGRRRQERARQAARCQESRCRRR